MKIELGALPPNPRDLTLSGQDREEGDGTIVIPLFRQLGGARVASLRSSILPQLKPFLTGADHKTRQALKPSRKLSRMCSDKSVKDVLVRTCLVPIGTKWDFLFERLCPLRDEYPGLKRFPESSKKELLVDFHAHVDAWRRRSRSCPCGLAGGGSVRAVNGYDSPPESEQIRSNEVADRKGIVHIAPPIPYWSR